MHGSALDCDWSTVSVLTTIVFQSRSTVLNLSATFYSPVNQDSPTKSRALMNLGWISYILIHQGLVYLNDPLMGLSSSKSASSMEDVTVGLRGSSKYPFYCPTVSSVDVSRTLSPLDTVLVEHCCPLLSHTVTVCQIHLKADH